MWQVNSIKSEEVQILSIKKIAEEFNGDDKNHFNRWISQSNILIWKKSRNVEKWFKKFSDTLKFYISTNKKCRKILQNLIFQSKAIKFWRESHIPIFQLKVRKMRIPSVDLFKNNSRWKRPLYIIFKNTFRRIWINTSSKPSNLEPVFWRNKTLSRSVSIHSVTYIPLNFKKNQTIHLLKKEKCYRMFDTPDQIKCTSFTYDRYTLSSTFTNGFNRFQPFAFLFSFLVYFLLNRTYHTTTKTDGFFTRRKRIINQTLFQRRSNDLLEYVWVTHMFGRRFTTAPCDAMSEHNPLI